MHYYSCFLVFFYCRAVLSPQMNWCFIYFVTARRVCISRTMPSQGVCLSVCPSHAAILSAPLNVSSKVSPTIIVFSPATASGTLLVPRARIATGQRSFAVNGPRTWNSLPADLRTHTRLCAPSSVIKRPTCFSSWSLLLISGSAPFVRRHCDCLASSAPFINTQTYLLTYLLTYVPNDNVSMSVGHLDHVLIVYSSIRYSVRHN